ncbi:MAG TPA: hypothetical protein VF720_15385, partial [Candidatus Eisenbacteria bacterium]
GNLAGANLTFTGAASNTFSGTGPTTDIRTLTINKGTSNANVLEITTSNFTVQGGNTDAASMAYLTLTNGTLKISGNFTLAGRTFTAAGFTIGTTAGFWLNNPNYTVSGQNGSSTVNWLRVSQGTLNIGTASGNSMQFSNNATVIVEGGAINATGRFCVSAAANNLNYVQTGGTITVCTVGNASATLASFDLGQGTGLDPVITGGTVICRLANTSATIRDYRNEQGPTGGGVTGGTVQFGDAGSGAAKAFQANGIFPDVVISNTSGNHTLTLRAPSFFFNNMRNVTINTGNTLNLGVGTNNLLFISGSSTVINNGTIVSNSAGNRFIYFTPGANGGYTGSGTSTGAMTSLESQAGSVTMSQVNNLVVRRVIIFTGNFLNSGKITLGDGSATLNVIQIGNTTSPTAAGTFDAPLTFNLGTGGQQASYLRTGAARSTGGEINPGRTLVNFTQDDTAAFPPHPLTLSGGDVTVTSALNLTNGRIVTGASKVIANGTVARTAGHVDGNLQKPVAVGAAVARTFEIGAANGYTPVSVTFATVTGAGALVARSTTGDHANIATSPVNPAKSVNRYYTLTNLGTVFTTADETATFLPGDVDGGANTANFVTGKYDSPNWSPTTTGTRTATTTQATGITSFSDFQIGEAQWSITATAGAGGTIAPTGTSYVANGGNLSYTITPSACFVIADVVVDGVSQGPIASYDFLNVTANHTISATFTAALAYTIVASAGAGGSISPSGNVSVPCGGDQAFTITPDGCHTIADVLVDGVSVGAVANYNFNAVGANHTISASFAVRVYSIVASAGTGGNISPSGNVYVNCGDDQSFTITTDACYTIRDVLVDGVSVGAVSNYSFVGVTSDHTIAAYFQIIPWTLTSSAGPGGSITPTVVVDCGSSYTFTITPDPCYAVADVLVDGVSVGAVTSYEFTNVQDDHTISATFALTTYTITATAGPGGSISPSGNVNVNCGDDQGFTITPDPCYEVVDVIVDGVSQGSLIFHQFNDVQANHTISATFALSTYTITATAGPGGSIVPSGAVPVTCGDDQTFTITPDACHTILDVQVDGSSVGPVANYTFNDVTSDHIIDATFALSQYTITATAAPGGSITPSGANLVDCGDDLTFLIEPDLCWAITDVVVDGSSVGAVTSYTFSDVMANHTIDAYFALTNYTITATAGPNGSIRPSGNVTVGCGEDQKFTIDPAVGFELCELTVDGESVPVTGSYTFSNVGANHTIHAEFCDIQCPSVAVVAPNGGETLIIGASYPIQWTATDNVSVTCVDILVSYTGLGGPWTSIATCIPNSSPYNWTVVGPASNNAAIKVVAHDAAGNACDDISDREFRIIDFVVPVLLSQFAANPISDGVELRWKLTDAFEFARVNIERGDLATGPFEALAAPITIEGGQSVLVDRTVEVGQTYFYRLAGITREGQVVTFEPLQATAGRPVTEFALAPIANNPARDNVRIAFSVPKDSHVRLSVVDVQGRPVATLIDDTKAAGSYQATWSGDSDRNGRAPSGIYFILMEAPGTKLVQRVALVH